MVYVEPDIDRRVRRLAKGTGTTFSSLLRLSITRGLPQIEELLKPVTEQRTLEKTALR